MGPPIGFYPADLRVIASCQGELVLTLARCGQSDPPAFLRARGPQEGWRCLSALEPRITMLRKNDSSSRKQRQNKLICVQL